MVWASVGVSAIILIVQIVVAAVSYRTIHRNRAIYSLKTHVYRLPNGVDDFGDVCNPEQINKDLVSGKYTIVQVVHRPADSDLEIVLGQIKK